MIKIGSDFLKSKRSDSRLHFHNIQERLKCKRSQEVFGMSFGMIFSIILIIFFLVAAFTAIKYFLDYQKEAQIRMFFENFQDKVNSMYGSAGIVGNEYTFEARVPSDLRGLCYIQYYSDRASYTGECKNIAGNLSIQPSTNFAFYSEKYDKILRRAGYKNIENINSASLPSGADTACYCFSISDEKVSIKIITTTDNSVVHLETA